MRMGSFSLRGAAPVRSGFAVVLLTAAVMAWLEGIPAHGADTATRPSPVARPNIVYIIADDLGYGDVHALNPERGKIPTPYLDRLTTQGMTFTDAHGGSSVCTPTRYGVLTGRYAWRTRLKSGVLSGYDPPLIDADRLTVPALLKRHGYHTAAFGKWHLGFTVTEPVGARAAKPKGKFAGAPLGSVTRDGPVTRGFDEYVGFHHARMMQTLFENDRATVLVNPVDMLPLLTRRVVAHIADRAKAGTPFFVYFALNSPHTPIVPTPAWQGKSGLGDYGDFVMETDWAVGEVLGALEHGGLAKNTLVIFTSDNGCSPAAGIDKLEKQGHYPSAGFRGHKADIWDGGHRIPFIARWPGHIAAGTTNPRLVCLTDLMATCAELMGDALPATAGEDSISMLTTLLGHETDDTARHDAVVHHSISGRFAIRKGRWKLEFCPGSGGWSKPKDAEAKHEGLPDIQLYDLDADPGETTNLQAAHPEVVASLRSLLNEYISEGRSTPGPRQPNDRNVTVVEPAHRQ